MYLTCAAVLRALAALARLADGSVVCFDHRVVRQRLNPVEAAVDEAMERQAAAAGEPWLSAFDPVQWPHELQAFGFAAVEAVSPAALNALYFARRKDGLCVGQNPRLICARVGAPAAG